MIAVGSLAGLAQLVEHHTCNMVVAGSIPATGSMTLYYEMHITIEFPGEDHIDGLKEMASIYDFHMGDLLLMKNEDERSHKDLFFTGRVTPKSETTEELDNLWALHKAILTTETFCRVLNIIGYNVIRYKIEDTVYDSKIKDVLEVMANG